MATYTFDSTETGAKRNRSTHNDKHWLLETRSLHQAEAPRVEVSLDREQVMLINRIRVGITTGNAPGFFGMLPSQFKEWVAKEA